jgi:hypothetical protein
MAVSSAAAGGRESGGEQRGAKAVNPFANSLVRGLNLTSRLFGFLLSRSTPKRIRLIA